MLAADVSAFIGFRSQFPIIYFYFHRKSNLCVQEFRVIQKERIILKFEIGNKMFILTSDILFNLKNRYFT